MSDVPSKAVDNSLEKNTDMAGGDSKSSNPPDSDFAMSTPPTLVVVSEGVVQASVIKHIPKGGIGFLSSGNVEMADSDKKVSNLQQCKDNTASNAITSIKLFVLNKVITPIWNLGQHKS